MKNRRTLGAFLSLSIFLLSLAVSFPLFANEIVTVGIYENPPKVFTSESGTPSGIFIDIIQHIAKKEGWELRYMTGTWSEGLDRLEKGEIDLMPDVAYTSDRDQIFAFHKVSVLSSWFQVYAPKGSGIRSLLDLGGKRIAVLERSVQQESFLQLTAGFGLKTTLISLPDYATIFEVVAKGGADAAITNRYYGLMHAKKMGLEDTAVIFNPSDLFFAAPENTNKKLLDKIDLHLLNLKNDTKSIYYQSLKRWTSEEVHFKLPQWVKILGLVATVVLLMSLGGSVLLKHQVNARTEKLSQRNGQMVIINQILRSTTSQMELHHILENALKGALDLTGLEGGSLYLMDSEACPSLLSLCVSINSSSEINDELSRRAIAVKKELFGPSGTSFILWGDAAGTELFHGEIKFYGAFPMTVQEETIGLLCLFPLITQDPTPTPLALLRISAPPWL